MPEISILLDAETGTMIVEDHQQSSARLLAELAKLVGWSDGLLCARPSKVLSPPKASDSDLASQPCIRVYGYYHNSLIEGPGRRTTVLFAGCNSRCKGCAVPYLQPITAGSLVSVGSLADALLDPAYSRNGVSISGGEPFLQPDGLLALVRALRKRGCRHILVYTGYTYEGLLVRARQEPAIGAVLDEIDILIDGPYVEALTDEAGPWTGSGNQRVIHLQALRRRGKLGSATGRSSLIW